VVDLASLSWIVTTTGMQGFRVLGDVGLTYELAFASRSDLAQVQRLLDAALREIPPRRFSGSGMSGLRREVARRTREAVRALLDRP
jgi:hypothetical protein